MTVYLLQAVMHPRRFNMESVVAADKRKECMHAIYNNINEIRLEKKRVDLCNWSNPEKRSNEGGTHIQMRSWCTSCDGGPPSRTTICTQIPYRFFQLIFWNNTRGSKHGTVRISMPKNPNQTEGQGIMYPREVQKTSKLNLITTWHLSIIAYHFYFS